MPTRDPALPRRPTGSRPSFPRTDRGLALALLGAVLITTFCAAFHTLFNPDYWFHLRGGEEVWAGRIPRVDSFSFPSAGRPYVDLHWLFQAALWAIHRTGGVALAVWCKTIIVMTSFALVYRTARRDAPVGVAATVCGFAVILGSERFQVRPELATFLALASCLWLVRRNAEGWRPAVWMLPLVHLVWVNVEGLFVLGFVVLAAALSDRWRDTRLWLASAGALAATCLNPYFVEGVLHPLVLLSRIDGSTEIYSATIGEFIGPFEGGIAHPAVTLFPFFLGALAVSLALSRRLRLSEIVLLAVFVTLSLQARRNLALLALVSVPILARWIALIPARPEMARLWKQLPPTLTRGLGPILAIVLALGFLVYDAGLVTNRIYARIETNREFGSGIATLAVPEEAAAFLRQHQVSGPVFSTLASGSYLIWADPERPVFVDGRLEVHTAEHYARYLSILGGGEAWAAADREFAFGALLLDHAEAPLLTRERLADPAWTAVWVDAKAVVLVRRNADNAALIRESGYDQDRLLREFPPWRDDGVLLPPDPSWGRQWLSVVHVPWSEISMGQLLSQIGAVESAVTQFRAASFAAPELTTPRLLLTTALNQMGRTEDALAALDSAEGRWQAGDDALRLLATRGDILLTGGRAREAEYAYSRYLAQRSGSPESGIVQANRGWARLAQGDAEGAASDLEAGLSRQPGYREAWRLLGEAQEARGRRAEALQAYRTYQQSGGQSAEVTEAIDRLSAAER